VLSPCRRLLALRYRARRWLADFENLAVTEGVWAYRTGSLVVAANFTDQPRTCLLRREVLPTTSAEQAPPPPACCAPGKA
jgi:hypothetical protein